MKFFLRNVDMMLMVFYTSESWFRPGVMSLPRNYDFLTSSFVELFFASRFPPASSSRCPARAASRFSVLAVSWPDSFCREMNLSI
jgi:hypothetical protein